MAISSDYSYLEEIEKCQKQILEGDKAAKRLADIITANNCISCPRCGHIISKEKLCEGEYTTTSNEVVYMDSGYGDDDELADVTYLYKVKRCPACGYELDRSKHKIGERNRHKRNSD